MKFLIPAVFCAGFIFFPMPVLAEIHTTQDLSGVYYHVEGNTSQSFYPVNEADYIYEGSVDFRDALAQDYELFGNINYRSTDDRTLDNKDFSIERMFIGLNGKAKEFLIGDFYSSFSEYSLNNALKGIKLSFGDEKTPRLIIVGGVDTSKWEDVWAGTWNDDSATRRFVWGTRLENNLLNNKLFLAFNYGGANDDKSYINPAAIPILVNVFSIDGKYNFNQYVSAVSEIAQSITDENTRESDIDTKGERALKFGLNFNSTDYTLNSTYSRMGKHFYTTGGFSAQDLESMNFDGMWFLPLKIRFNHYLRLDKDNLSKSALTTTKQLNPGGKFNFTLPFEVIGDLGVDLRKRFSTDKSANDKTYTYTSNFSRDFRILYASLGYKNTIVTDRVNASQKRDTDTYSFALDGDFNIKDLKLSWNFAEDIERSKYLEAEKADFITSSNLGLKLVFPSTLTFEARTVLADNDYYLNETDSKNSQYYFSVSRDLMKDNLLFDLSYERKGFRYFGGDNNFAETFIRGKIEYKF